MKKGFTLVELLAVLTLLAVIAVISVPIMDSILGKSSTKTKDSQVNEILQAAKKYVLKYDNELEFDDDNEILIPLEDIKKSEFLNNEKMINAETDEEFNGCVYVKYNENNGKTNYAYFHKCETINYTGRCFTFRDGEIKGLDTEDEECKFFDNLVIPTYIYGQKVRSINYVSAEDEAYLSYSKNIDFSKALYLETINKDAFGSQLASLVTYEQIDLSNNSILHTINKRAFSSDNLIIRKVKLPDNIKTIEEAAFKGNSLTEIELPSKLEYIGEDAFRKNKIETLEIPSSVFHLGYKSFANNRLKSVTINGKKEISDFEIYDNVFNDNANFNDNKIIWKQ